MYVHTYKYMYIYIYICIYTQICKHIYTHAYVHIHTLSHLLLRVISLLKCWTSFEEGSRSEALVGVSKHHFLFRGLETSFCVPHVAFCSARHFLFCTSLCVSHVTLCLAPCASQLALRIARRAPLVPPQPLFSLISLGSSGSIASASCTIPASIMTLVLRFCRRA